eukprot:1844927-Prymnesium_polylepis.2
MNRSLRAGGWAEKRLWQAATRRANICSLRRYLCTSASWCVCHKPSESGCRFPAQRSGSITSGLWLLLETAKPLASLRAPRRFAAASSSDTAATECASKYRELRSSGVAAAGVKEGAAQPV